MFSSVSGGRQRNYTACSEMTESVGCNFSTKMRTFLRLCCHNGSNCVTDMSIVTCDKFRLCFGYIVQIENVNNLSMLTADNRKL